MDSGDGWREEMDDKAKIHTFILDTVSQSETAPFTHDTGPTLGTEMLLRTYICMYLVTLDAATLFLFD